VTLLSVISSTGSIYITEADDVSIGETAVTTQEVILNASLNPVVDAPQSGLVTGVNGNIVLTSGAGSLTVVPGAMVSANGTGNIRLEAATQLLLSEHLSSGTGHITLLAGNGLTVSETIVISTFSSGSVYADAGNGALNLPAAGGITPHGVGVHSSRWRSTGQHQYREPVALVGRSDSHRPHASPYHCKYPQRTFC
jgi:hypothetical protein